MTKVASVALLMAFSLPPFANDKKDLTERYEGKFLVVLREGLSVGLCHDDEDEPVTLALRLADDRAEIAPVSLAKGLWHAAGVIADDPATVNACVVDSEPIHTGEILIVDDVEVRRGQLVLTVSNVAPHQITRGIGANSHETFETGHAQIAVDATPEDYTQAAGILSHWVRLFDSKTDAMQFGNTASGVLVKEVKAGMSFAEVEAALGPPSTKVDLGEKVLYKYKDMTVEFHDGKVTDVR